MFLKNEGRKKGRKERRKEEKRQAGKQWAFSKSNTFGKYWVK